jgi:ribonuclease D
MAKKEGVRVTSGTIEHVNVAPSAADRPAYLRDEKYMLAVDTETTGFNWFDGDRPFLATVSDYDRDWMYYLPINAHDEEHFEDGTAALREAILAADALIFHNASFDIHMLVTAGVASLGELLDKEIHDT